MLSSSLLFAHGSSCKLTLVDVPDIIMDPACATCDDSGVAVFQLRNDNSNPVKLVLTSSSLISKTTGKPTHAKVTMTVVEGLGGSAAKQKVQAEPKENVFVQVEVKGLLEEGEWQAEIHNQGTNLGSFKVIKYHWPLGIKLDVPNADNPELGFELGQPLLITLKNSDAISYPLCWSLFVDGVSSDEGSNIIKDDGSDENKKGNDGQRGGKESEAKSSCALVVLPAKGAGSIKITSPPVAWFHNRWFEGIFRNESVSGQLALSFRRQNTGRPSLESSAMILPFKANLAYYSKTSQRWRQAFIVLVTLFAGALFSVVLGAWIPNFMARVEIKRELEKLHQDIREMSLKLSSRVRVPLGVEAGRLSALIAAHGALRWAQFAAVTSDVKQAIQKLQKRVILVQALGEKRDRFEALLEYVLFPSLIQETEAKFDKAIDALRRTEVTDAELQEADATLKEIDANLKSLADRDASNTHRPALLAKRAAVLRRELDLVAPHNWENFPLFIQRLWSRFNESSEYDDSKKYAYWDLIFARMEILKDYFAYQQTNSIFKKNAPENLLDRLVADLQQNTWKGFRAARLLADEMKDLHFKSDLENEIRNFVSGNVPSVLYHPPKTRLMRWVLRTLRLEWLRSHKVDSIESEWSRINPRNLEVRLESSEVRPFQPIYFCLSFTKAILNDSPVKQEYRPSWNFHHDHLTPETGWNVTHYFPKTGPYWVTVTLYHQEDGLVAVDGHPVYAGTEVQAYQKKGPGQSGFWLNVVQLLAIIFLAALGLFTGAQEQFLKLDTIPALITIFMMGFGSDRVKSLLIQKSNDAKQ